MRACTYDWRGFPWWIADFSSGMSCPPQEPVEVDPVDPVDPPRLNRQSQGSCSGVIRNHRNEWGLWLFGLRPCASDRNDRNRWQRWHLFLALTLLVQTVQSFKGLTQLVQMVKDTLQFWQLLLSSKVRFRLQLVDGVDFHSIDAVREPLRRLAAGCFAARFCLPHCCSSWPKIRKRRHCKSRPIKLTRLPRKRISPSCNSSSDMLRLWSVSSTFSKSLVDGKAICILSKSTLAPSDFSKATYPLRSSWPRISLGPIW